MKRLHIFLIKSFIGPFLATFFISIFLLLMQFLWKYIDDLVGKGLEIHQLAELLFYASARFIPIALPISVLLSSVLVFGKLAEQYELAALKSSGISLYRLMMPIGVLVIIISFSSFLFSNYLMPIANLKNGSMIYDIQKTKPTLNIKEGVFYNDIKGFSIKVGKKDKDGKTVFDLLIYDHRSGKSNNNLIIAEKGKLELTPDNNYLIIKLYNGYSYNDIDESSIEKKFPFRVTKFKRNKVKIDLNEFKTKVNSEELYRGHYAMLNNSQLTNAIDSLTNRYMQNKEIFTKNISERYNKSFINKKTLNKSNLGWMIKYSTVSIIENQNKKEIKSKREKTNIFRKYNIALNKLRSLKSITKSHHSSLKYREIIINKHKIEWHRKYSLAIACFLFFLVGAPLGAIVKKGSFGVPVLLSVTIFILYHVLNMIGEKSAKELTMQAYEGMWIANLVCLPFAFFLLHKAKNDLKLFNLTRVYLFFNSKKK